MIKINRDFKGIWIPRDIWLSEDLTDTEKFLIAEIDSLDCGTGCWANNKHLSHITRRARGTVENVLGRLVKKGIVLSVGGKDGTSRRLSISPFAHAIVGKEWDDPLQRGLPRYNSSIQIQQNTTDCVAVATNPETAPVEDKKPNWDICHNDLQRFVGFYIKNYNEALYKDGTKEQVTGFFSTYGKMFANMLKMAGSLEIACNALVYFDRHFKEKGWSWNLKTLLTNYLEFVNFAMQKKKEEKG